MTTLAEGVMRVVYKVDGQSALKNSRNQITGIERDTERLNVALVAAGAAFVQFSKTAIQSFGNIETAMAKFASRAGWELGKFRRETEQATHNIARLTGVRHGIVIQAVQEGISQGALQGMKVPEILKLVREGAKLHAAGQTDLRHAVSSAITARQYGAPSAPYGQRLIYSASQVGAGDPAQYGKEYKDVAPGGHLLNIEMSETLGALALIAGAAPSLAEGATWIKALYRTFSNPQQDAQTLFRERMGYEFTEIQNMVGERGGLAKVVRLLTENFKGPELMAMFGRQEAVQGLAALGAVPGQLLRLQNAVRENAVDDPVARAWTDNMNTWHVTLEKFGRSFETLMRSVGTPLVAVMKQVLNAVSWLFDALTTLNDTLFKVPGTLVALVGALVGLRGAINVLQSAWGVARSIGGLGGEDLSSVLFGSRLDADTDRQRRHEREDERDRRNRSNRGWNTFSETAGDAAMGGAAAWWGSRKAKDFAQGAAHTASENVWTHLRDTGFADFVRNAHRDQRRAGAYRGDREGYFDAAGAGAGSRKRQHRRGRGWWQNAAGSALGASVGGDWVGGAPFWGADYAEFMNGFSPTDGTTRRANKWERFTGDMHSRGMAAGATAAIIAKRVGSFLFNLVIKHGWRATKIGLVGALGGAVVSGFKWWYKKTLELDSTKAIYDRVGMRSIATDFLNNPENKEKSLRHVTGIGDIDVALFKAQQAEDRAAAAEEKLAKLLGQVGEDAAIGGGPLHTFLAHFLAGQKELRADLKYMDSFEKSAWTLKGMQALDPDSPQTKALEDYIEGEKAKMNPFQRYINMFHAVTGGLFKAADPIKNNALGGPLELHGMAFTQNARERFQEQLRAGELSEDWLLNIARWKNGGELPVAPEKYPSVSQLAAHREGIIDGVRRSLMVNPHMKIEINIGTVNEGSVEQITEAVETGIKKARSTEWIGIADYADVPNY